MNRDEFLTCLNEIGAVITDDHIVYKSGKHGSAYVAKDVLYRHTHLTAEVCRLIAQDFRSQKIEIVIGPVVGGAILSQWVAYFLQTFNTTHDVEEVLSAFADNDGDGFVLKRGFADLVRGKRILVVDDVLTTGGSVKKVVELVRQAGGIIVAVVALVNRGGVTAEDIGAPTLTTFQDIQMDSWSEHDCPLCKRNVPINIEVGHGKTFLEKKAAAGDTVDIRHSNHDSPDLRW